MADPTASSHPDRSLDYLEHESERNRAGFAETLGELRNRLSGDAVSSEVKQRVSRAGQSMLADLERKARDNPLRTVAVGAGLAYPVWQALRNLPAPILLLGAGVALAGRKDRPQPADLRFDGTAESLSARQGFAGGSSEQRSSKVTEAGSAISSAAQAFTERVGEVASSAVVTARRTVSAASELGSSSYQSGLEATSHAGQRAAVVGRAGRDGLVEAVERHPLMVGGLSVLVGAAIAACIPSSRTEGRLFGEASDHLKDQARASASHGLDVVRAAGERIVENTLHEAEEQGLTAEGAHEAVRDIGDKARVMADSAAKAALPEDRS